MRKKNELRRKNREEVMGKVTIQSMAKELGLSRNTVAMALKDDPKVAPVTRERVLRMAKRNGYLGENVYVEEVRAPQEKHYNCLLYTSPSPRDLSTSRMPSSA